MGSNIPPYLSDPWLENEPRFICRHLNSSSKIDPTNLLKPRELQKWEKFSIKSSYKHDWLLGILVAKEIFCQWAYEKKEISLELQDIEILNNPRGKPYIACPKLASLGPLPDISISHSKGEAIAALSLDQTQIGIDFEFTNHQFHTQWWYKAFNPEELALIPEIPSPLLLACWCAKEATSKAYGTGFKVFPRKWMITEISPDQKKVWIEYNQETFEVCVWISENDITAICQWK